MYDYFCHKSVCKFTGIIGKFSSRLYWNACGGNSGTETAEEVSRGEAQRCWLEGLPVFINLMLL
ncbi:unnamed protein product [Coffea canephora]|uniref:Uncharacterized protein n=1 Tax=Coffea canephora TaxID=49390 RepID=A0A068U7C1_COFCA|nr:unnamed protein product [Coffea canephora]